MAHKSRRYVGGLIDWYDVLSFGDHASCHDRHCLACAVRDEGAGWWITGLPCGPTGPYRTKGEASSDLSGLRRWYSKNCAEIQPLLIDKKGSPGQMGLFDE